MIQDFFPLVSRPCRYLGGEVNACHKDIKQAELRFALCFPDAYEIGMSHLGMQILYGLLNDQEGIVCERVFNPWFDMEAFLRSRNIPLSSLESDTPLSEFDVIGFSHQYELCYTNILNILSLAQIPLLARERGADMPVIIGGGPCAFNPEPLAEFMDFIALGEGEEILGPVVETLRSRGREPGSRERLLEKLAQIEGVYVPSLYRPCYEEDGRLKSFEARAPNWPGKVRLNLGSLHSSGSLQFFTARAASA